MEITLTLRVVRTDGPTVDQTEVTEGLAEYLEGFTFEAGDEPSVFEVTDATVD